MCLLNALLTIIPEITTVEGVIDKAIADLTQDQERRKEQSPEVAEKVDSFIQRLSELKLVKTSFTVVCLLLIT